MVNLGILFCIFIRENRRKVRETVGDSVEKDLLLFAPLLLEQVFWGFEKHLKLWLFRLQVIALSGAIWSNMAWLETSVAFLFKTSIS